MKRIILLMIAGLMMSLSLYSQVERFTRLTPEQLTNLANPRRLSHIIFYREKSKGPNAKWFDAVKEGNLEEIKKMVESGQDIEVQDTASLKQTALGWAAFIGYLDVVEYLYPLYNGKLNLNEQDKRDGETMLMVAAGNSREDAVKFLLDKKVDVNIISKQLNKTAYTYACESKNQNIISMIKAAGGTNIRTGKASCN